MIFRTEAIVLRTIPYGETSRIVTLFTRARGKITVIAKGVRVPGSRFGASLEPLTYSEIVFYFKQGRGIHMLRESSIVTPLLKIHRDVRCLGVGLRVIELVSALLHDEEENPFLFNLLLQVLHYLNRPLRFPENLLSYFQLRLAGALGFAPRIDRDAVVALPADGAHVSLESGEILRAPGQATRHASRSAIRTFAIFARADIDSVVKLELAPAVRMEADRLVEEFMRYHVEESYPRRTRRVLDQIQDLASRSSDELK